MGIQQDPIQVCGHPFPVSFLQMLMSVLVVDDATGAIGIRYTKVDASTFCGCTPLVDCDNNHVPPETLLVQAFGLDGCGKLALRLINCDGTDTETEGGEPE